MRKTNEELMEKLDEFEFMLEVKQQRIEELEEENRQLKEAM